MQFRKPLNAVLTVFLALLMFSGSSTQAQETFIVGVRKEAPPFSYLESTNPDIYSGYIVEICKSVLKNMSKQHDFEIEYRVIEPSTRFTELGDGNIHILCDPATISQERLAQPNVMVSQPIYLSGIGMAAASQFDRWIGHWPCIGPLVGVVEGTTTRSNVIEKMANQSRFGKSRDDIIKLHPKVDMITLSLKEKDRFKRCKDKAMQDDIDLSRLGSLDVPSPVIKSFSDHSSLAKAVCDQKVLYSVGDLEIIAKALQVEKETNPNCEFQVDPAVTSEERYGIFVHVSDELNPTDKLAINFLRQLSIEIHKGHESVLISSFKNNLNAASVSRTLDVFFWNVIAGSNK